MFCTRVVYNFVDDTLMDFELFLFSWKSAIITEENASTVILCKRLVENLVKYSIKIKTSFDVGQLIKTSNSLFVFCKWTHLN